MAEGAALEEVELRAVVGEFDVHGNAVCAFEALEQAADLHGEGAFAHQLVEGDAEAGRIGVDVGAGRRREHAVAVDADELVEQGVFGGVLHELFERDGFEAVFGEVDESRVRWEWPDFGGRGFVPQRWHAQGTMRNSADTIDARVPRPMTMRMSPSSRLIRGLQRYSLRLKATPSKHGAKYGPKRRPTTRWIRTAMSSS